MFFRFKNVIVNSDNLLCITLNTYPDYHLINIALTNGDICEKYNLKSEAEYDFEYLNQLLVRKV